MSVRALAALAVLLLPSAAPKVDVEVDPLAYAFGGYSLHVGVGAERLRLDLGAFAMDLPEFAHGNEGFDASFHGYGLKLQYFPFDAGAFVGVGVGVNEVLAQRHGGALAARDTRIGAGVQAGWKIPVAAGFYVTPWVGVDYAFDAEEIRLDGATFEANPWSVFPTVHLGYDLL